MPPKKKNSIVDDGEVDHQEEHQLPTLPNTPEKPQQKKHHQQYSFLFHDSSSTTTSIDTKLLPIRIFIRVMSTSSALPQTFVSEISQQEEEQILSELFFADSAESVLSSLSDSVVSKLTATSSSSSKKNSTTPSSASCSFISILRFSPSSQQVENNDFESRTWQVDCLSVGEGYISPLFCRDPSKSPFSPAIPTNSSTTAKRRAREGTANETMMMSNTYPILSFPPASFSTKLNKCYQTILSGWSPAEVPLQFSIVIRTKQEVVKGRSTGLLMNNSTLSSLQNAGSIGYPSPRFEQQKEQETIPSQQQPPSSSSATNSFPVIPVFSASRKASARTSANLMMISSQDRKASEYCANNNTSSTNGSNSDFDSQIVRKNSGRNNNNKMAQQNDHMQDDDDLMNNKNSIGSIAPPQSGTAAHDGDDASPSSLVKVKQTGSRTANAKKESKKETSKTAAAKKKTAATTSKVNKEEPLRRTPSASVTKKSKAILLHEKFSLDTEREAAMVKPEGDVTLSIVTAGVHFDKKQKAWIGKFSNDFLKLNASQSTTPAEFMCLGATFHRSIKLMCALATATKLVNEDWIYDAVSEFSTKSSQIPDVVRKHMIKTADDYPVDGKALKMFNAENSCTLDNFVRRIPIATRLSLLRGKQFDLSKMKPAFLEEGNDVRDVVRAFGGTVVNANNSSSIRNSGTLNGDAESSTTRFQIVYEKPTVTPRNSGSGNRPAVTVLTMNDFFFKILNLDRFE